MFRLVFFVVVGSEVSKMNLRRHRKRVKPQKKNAETGKGEGKQVRR